MFRLALFLACSVFVAQPGSAATYTASISNGLCGFLVDNSDNPGHPGGSASLTCGTTSAQAAPGVLRARAEAFFNVTSSGVESQPFASAGASIEDYLSFSGLETGFLLIPVDISGTFTFGASGSGNSFAFGSGSASAQVNNDPIFSVTRTASIAEETSSGGPPSSISMASFAIEDGLATVSASIGVQASCSAGTGGGFALCSALVDYGSSLRFLGASVFDSFGNERDDVLISASSGFDYRTGFEPHMTPAAVIPLPAPGLLLLSAILGLFGALRLRKTGLSGSA